MNASRIVAGVAFLACPLPARRANFVDSIEALQTDELLL
ncbi:MAG: hypothetical protein QOE34_1303 [Verrucomicrobiota bacterium]|jgi:ABC-type lipoprotein release transport system permease subunit